jgi:ribonuclease VapC
VILDSSAIIAIILKEPGHARLQEQLAMAATPRVAAPTLVETAMVLCARLGPAGKSLLARFVVEADLEVVDFTAEHWTVAADAFIRYGKGRHRAALNFGDFLTYAVTKLSGTTLLCTGNDFPETDLELAVDRAR